MKKIVIKSFAKINLTLDVLGVLDNGYHELAMIMQQILLCDDVQIKWTEAQNADVGTSETGDASDIKIELSTNRKFLPTDNRNLAYKAADAMIERYGEGKSGTIRIDIKKRIPVAAGLAGGSGNAAAVLHGLNKLWDLGLDVAALCEIGAGLGSDIPF
ncbi:MAG: 4-(cytidine 5'-diphospho)-2-C-methyl-D-erythritol kinase, partial [Firmicutes bacterium]|nr:4-(cytidine 5'-diphospho)-2-C-methyl-D-erythritol kinase [Bacillota bacterium]